MWRILRMPPFFQAGVVPAGGGWVQMQCVRVGQQQQRPFAVAAELLSAGHDTTPTAMLLCVVCTCRHCLGPQPSEAVPHRQVLAPGV
jgi:hypothetical protein